MHKNSCLKRAFVNYGCKKFDSIDTGSQCYKTFSVRDLHIFVLS